MSTCFEILCTKNLGKRKPESELYKDCSSKKRKIEERGYDIPFVVEDVPFDFTNIKVLDQ